MRSNSSGLKEDNTVIKVGIVGGTGYTGVELLRILVNHPEVELKVITSRSEEGVRVDDMFQSLRGHTDLRFSVPDAQKLGECDVVFFATPHGVAHSMATRSEEHTSELQSRPHLVCRLLLEKKKKTLCRIIP